MVSLLYPAGWPFSETIIPGRSFPDLIQIKRSSTRLYIVPMRIAGGHWNRTSRLVGE
jgi:hypothetical protein